MNQYTYIKVTSFHGENNVIFKTYFHFLFAIVPFWLNSPNLLVRCAPHNFDCMCLALVPVPSIYLPNLCPALIFILWPSCKHPSAHSFCDFRFYRRYSWHVFHFSTDPVSLGSDPSKCLSTDYCIMNFTMIIWL